MQILVIEEEPVSMKKLSNGLQAFGHSFLEASDGIKALNIYYNNDDIDLIITDLAMLHGS